MLDAVAAAIARLFESQVGDRKIADSRSDFRTGQASLCPWERHFAHIFDGAKQSARSGGPA